MDEIVRRAIIEYDLAKRDDEIWEYQRQRRSEQQAREQQEREQHAAQQLRVRAWLAHTSGNQFDASAQAETMDEASSRPWNEWAGAHVDVLRCEVSNELDEIHDWIIEHITTIKKNFERRQKADDDLANRLDDLEQRFSDLEARVADLEGSGEQQKIVPMLTFRKGPRDAA